MSRQNHSPVAAEMKRLRASFLRSLRQTHDDAHEHERALTRQQMIFDLFYDDEAHESDVAIRDALTDLMHMAQHRGVDFDAALARASTMWHRERKAWQLTT